MVVELRLAFSTGSQVAVWFLCVCAVMRLNRNLSELYPQLFAASSLKDADNIIASCNDRNSITQLGNVSFEEHLEDLRILWSPRMFVDIFI